VLSYAPCREGIWRSGSISPCILKLITPVGIVTALWAGQSGLRIWAGPGYKINLLTKTSRPAVGPTQPHIQWYLGPLQGLKRPECEVDHSLVKPRLGMRAAVHLRQLFAFMARTWTAFTYVEVDATFTLRLLYFNVLTCTHRLLSFFKNIFFFVTV
jgi:hypothetical protein